MYQNRHSLQLSTRLSEKHEDAQGKEREGEQREEGKEGRWDIGSQKERKSKAASCQLNHHPPETR